MWLTINCHIHCFFFFWVYYLIQDSQNFPTQSKSTFRVCKNCQGISQDFKSFTFGSVISTTIVSSSLQKLNKRIKEPALQNVNYVNVCKFMWTMDKVTVVKSWYIVHCCTTLFVSDHVGPGCFILHNKNSFVHPWSVLLAMILSRCSMQDHSLGRIGTCRYFIYDISCFPYIQSILLESYNVFANNSCQIHPCFCWK